LSPTQALPTAAAVLLANGSTAAIVELPDSTLVAIDWRAPFGSADDGALRGASHWVASCLAARTQPQQPLGEGLSKLGARADVEADVEYLSVRLRAPARHAAALLSLATKLTRPPAARELHATRDFARARAGALLSSPAHTARAALLRELFELPTDRHPHADLLAPIAALDKAAAAAVAARAQALLDPKSTLFSIAGAVSARSLGSPVDAQPHAPGARATPSPLPSKAPRVVLVDHPGATRATATVGTLGPPAADPRSPLARAAWHVFEDVGSRDARFTGQRFRSGPQVLAWSITDHSDVATAWAMAWLAPPSPEPDAWTTVRVRASDARLFDLESAQGVASTYGELLQLGESPQDFDEARRLARDAPQRALEAALATHLAPRGWVVVIAGDAARIGPVLQRRSAVTVVSPQSDFSILRRLARTSAAGLR
jgi:predicted Zn-dependent peptidase